MNSLIYNVTPRKKLLKTGDCSMDKPPGQKLKARQERFCQNYVLSANAAGAAHEAGYSPRSARKQGYRLLATGRIGVRIGEIQARLAEGNGRHLDVLIGKLEVVYRCALENHHFAAATRAVELQARLSGRAVRELPDISGT